MRRLLPILLACFLFVPAEAAIRNWDTTGLTGAYICASMLRNHNPRLAAFNDSTTYPIQGSNESVTATLINMTSGYGFRPEHGGVIAFDGVDDRVDLNRFTAWTDANDWTFESWFWYSGNDGYIYNEEDTADNNNRFHVLVHTSGKVDALWVVAGSVERQRSAAFLTSPGVNHLVVRKDGSDVSIWGNGSEAPSYEVTCVWDRGNKTLSDISVIGRLYITNDWSTAMDYKVHFLSVYDYALSDATIAAHYNLGPEMGGIRAIPNSDSALAYDYADSIPSTPSGNDYALTSATHVVPIVVRRELCPDQTTASVLAINFGEAMKNDTGLHNGVAADGSNISMSNAGATEIPIELVDFSKTDTTGTIWFRPALVDSAADSTYYLCRGDSGSFAPGTDDSVTYNRTWGGSVDYVMALHMTGASATAIDDVTLNNNDVASDNGNPDYDQTGQIGNCVDLDGTGDYLKLADSPTLSLTTTGSVVAWVQPGSAANGTVVGRNTNGYIFNIQSTPDVRFGKNAVDEIVSASGYSVGLWHLLVATRSTSNNIYINGVLDKNGAGADFADIANDIFIGSNPANVANWDIDALIDEVRVLPAALGATDLALMYNNEDTWAGNAGFDIGTYAAIPASNSNSTAPLPQDESFQRRRPLTWQVFSRRRKDR